MRNLWKYLVGVAAALLCFTCFSACGSQSSVTLYDGAEKVGEHSVQEGAEYDFGAPEKTGYAFLGWYTKAEGGNALTDASGSSAGMTWKKGNGDAAYAHFQAETYRVVFSYEGATAQNDVADLSVVYDKKIDGRFPVPLKSGFSFAGWYTEKTGGTAITDKSGSLTAEAEVFTADVYPVSEGVATLYARWEEKVVAFRFFTEGSAVESRTYKTGSVLSELPYSVKDNYCFEAWCFDSSLMQALTYPYTVPDADEDLLLYARFAEGSNDVLRFDSVASSGDREYEVSYTGSDKKIVVPDSYFGKKVTRVKNFNTQDTETVLLPQSVKEFSAGAFENCTALTSVNLPAGLKEIPDRAFAGDGAITKLLLSSSLESVGKNAFNGCASIRTLTLPKTVRSVREGAFGNMSALKEINVEEGCEKYFSKDGVLYTRAGTSVYLTQYPAGKEGDGYEIDPATVKIAEAAFAGAKIASIEIGGKIATIEAGAFENCKNLISVTISTSSMSTSTWLGPSAIGAGAFRGCGNLRALKVQGTMGVVRLPEDVFDGVSEAFSIYVPSDQITTFRMMWSAYAERIYSLGMIFGDFALEECGDGYAVRQYFGTAKEVTVPDVISARKIVKISDYAFSFSGVEKVTVGKNVAEIGKEAFASCGNLQALVMLGSPPALGKDAFSGVKADFTVYVRNTTEVLDAYRAADGWSDLADRIWSDAGQN